MFLFTDDVNLLATAEHFTFLNDALFSLFERSLIDQYDTSPFNTNVRRREGRSEKEHFFGGNNLGLIRSINLSFDG